MRCHQQFLPLHNHVEVPTEILFKQSNADCFHRHIIDILCLFMQATPLP